MARKPPEPTRRVLLREVILRGEDLTDEGKRKLGVHEETAPSEVAAVFYDPLGTPTGGKQAVVKAYGGRAGRYRAPALESWDPVLELVTPKEPQLELRIEAPPE